MVDRGERDRTSVGKSEMLSGEKSCMAKYVENLIAADLQRSLLDEEVDS